MSDFGRPRKPASNLVLLVVVALAVLAAGCSHRSATSQQQANPAAADFATAIRNRVSTDAMMAHLSKLAGHRQREQRHPGGGHPRL